MNDKGLKKTDEMQRVLNRMKREAGRGIVFPEPAYNLSDYIVEKFRAVREIDFSEFEFYFYAYRPETLDTMKTIEIEVDYTGKAWEINRIKGWCELMPALTVIDCGRYRLQYYASQFYRNGDKMKLVLRYEIHPAPVEAVKAPDTIKEVTKIAAAAVKPKGGKDGESKR